MENRIDKALDWDSKISYEQPDFVTLPEGVYPITITKLDTLTKFKLIGILIIEYRSSKSAKSHIGRTFKVSHSKYSRLCFNIISRVDNSHTGNCAHKSDILIALVCCTIFTNRNTCVSSADNNVKVRITYRVANLFKSTSCRKHCK